MLPESDQQLVAAIEAGEEQGFHCFDTRFRHRIEGIARKRGIPPHDCADVAQEVLTDAVRQLQRGMFRGDSSLTTWLYPIIKSKLADYWRANRGPDLVPLNIANQAHVLATAGSQDDVVAVQQALSRLPAAEQFLLLLYERDQYTLEEIGRMIRLRKSAVAERLKRAREHFRAVLRDGGSPPVNQRLKE